MLGLVALIALRLFLAPDFFAALAGIEEASALLARRAATGSHRMVAELPDDDVHPVQALLRDQNGTRITSKKIGRHRVRL